MKDYKVHLFVCKSCRYFTEADQEVLGEGGEIRSQLKQWAKQNFNSSDIKISESSCLSHCSAGVSCVSYPENKWFLEQRVDSLDTIKDYITQKIK